MPRRRRPPMTGRQRVRVVCFFLSAALVALAWVGTTHMKSILSSLAVTRVSNAVGRLVSDAVEQAIDSGDIRYDRLISFRTGEDGHVTALESNMAEFSRLQSAVAQDVLERLEHMEEADLEIPLGTLTGSPLLAGRGPAFTVRMQAEGTCSVRFGNRFTQAGINQTMHSILLYVDVSVNILLPGFSTVTDVTNAFSVAETVIVGQVPDTYTYFDSGNPMEDDAFDFMMNQ